MNLTYEVQTLDTFIDEIIFLAFSNNQDESNNQTGTFAEFYGEEYWNRLPDIMQKQIYFRFMQTYEALGFQVYQDYGEDGYYFVRYGDWPPSLKKHSE